ncbi:unnamed protein product [[Candida] boidinii]|nr:unnamed protein product [[Candida] boidinii]
MAQPPMGLNQDPMDDPMMNNKMTPGQMSMLPNGSTKDYERQLKILENQNRKKMESQRIENKADPNKAMMMQQQQQPQQQQPQQQPQQQQQQQQQQPQQSQQKNNQRQQPNAQFAEYSALLGQLHQQQSANAATALMHQRNQNQHQNNMISPSSGMTNRTTPGSSPAVLCLLHQ